MIRINRVYTKSGDQGMTGIIGGERIPKDSLRIESYGTTDELQATLGLLRAALQESKKQKKFCAEVILHLHRIQNDLFDLGNALSTPEAHQDKVRYPITEERIQKLEKQMDLWTAQVPPLNSFVLSGGGTFSALTHLARTVCRRAERLVIRFGREEKIDFVNVRYLNRLSDFLFVLARILAKTFKEAEPLWETPLLLEQERS